MHHPSKLGEDELERLFQENYGLLVSQAISFNPRTQYELDDYIQIAAIGMMKACKNFDSTKSKFSTFATVCIRNALLNHIRGEKKKRPYLSDKLDENITYDKEHIDEIMPSNITQNEGFAIRMILEGYTYSEIADALGTSKQTVQNILYGLYRKIREANEI